MESISLYSEARNEYLKQMASWLSSPIVEFFRAEYQKISTMNGFQAWCADVPKWNQDVIETNVSKILDSCRCDYVEELMTAVFIAHTKMLTAIRVSTKQKKMKITLPKLDHFLHRVFIECARSFWKAPFLFLESVSLIEKQKNVLQMESMCIEALSSAVRSLLPVKSILNEYLEEEEDEPTAESTTEPVEEEVKVKEPKPAKVKPTLPLFTPLPEPMPSTISSTIPSTILSTIQTESIPIEPIPSTIFSTIQTEPILSTSLPPSKSKMGPSLLIKEDSTAPPALPPVAEKISIETEPSVHFTPYDTVFDETQESISEIRYTPKLSIEEKPPSTWEEEPTSLLTISSDESSLSMTDMEDLEAPAAPAVPAVVEEDVPLSALGEFEELS